MRHFILFLLIWGSFQSHAQQIVPEYPGGTAVLFKYLSDSLLLPPVLYKKGLKGETVVSFVVDTGGYVTDVHITRSLHPALDTAVIRLVSGMSRWSPGMADGHPVKVRYTLPIKVYVPKNDLRASAPKGELSLASSFFFNKCIFLGKDRLPFRNTHLAELRTTFSNSKINIGLSLGILSPKLSEPKTIKGIPFQEGQEFVFTSYFCEIGKTIPISSKLKNSTFLALGAITQQDVRDTNAVAPSFL